MLRTPAMTGSRGAMRLFAPARTGLRVQPLPRLRSPQTITQRTFTQRATSSRKPTTTFTFSSNARPSPATLLQRLRASIRFFHNSRRRLDAKPNSTNPAAEAEPTTLSGRMKKLSGIWMVCVGSISRSYSSGLPVLLPSGEIFGDR